MELLLIIIILILIFGTTKISNAIGGCFSAIFSLVLLGLLISIIGKIIGLFANIIAGINIFIETYGWLVVGLLIFTLLSIILLMSIYLYIKSKKKSLSIDFLNAVSTNNTTIALKLLKKNPNIDIRNSMSWTPLMLASRRGNIVLVNALIKSKAKLNIKNKFGDTSYVHAKFKGNNEIVNMLISAGAKKTQPSYMILITSILDNDIEGVKRCLSAGISPQSIAPSGKSALELAIDKNNTVIVAYLIKYGALPKSKEKQVETNANHDIRSMLSTGIYLKYIREYENRGI